MSHKGNDEYCDFIQDLADIEDKKFQSEIDWDDLKDKAFRFGEMALLTPLQEAWCKDKDGINAW